jgi:hypothetical protein
MAALTIERKTPKLGQDTFPSFPTNLPLPVAASTKLFTGAMVALATTGGNAGNVVQGQTATGLVALGVAEMTVDNSAGIAGALSVVPRQGVFLMNAGAGADAVGASNVGQLCYMIDDNTVGLTSGGGTRSVAGLVVAVDGGTPPFSQPTGVWVLLGLVSSANSGLLLPLSYPTIADAAAGTAFVESPIARVTAPTNVGAVLYIPNAAVAANGANFATLVAGWRNGSGGALQTLATLTTAATSPAAFQPTSLGAVTNPAMPAGAVLTFSIAKSGAGVQLPAGLIVVI